MRSDEEMRYRGISDRYLPERVREVPMGFVALDTAIREYDGVLSYLFWSTNFVIQDSEDVTIFQTDVKNSQVIVLYRNVYYINEEKFLEILEYAIDIYEQQSRIYEVGEMIEIRGLKDGNRIDFHIVITSIERNVLNENALYIINFLVDPIISDDYLLEFFYRVTTQGGNHSDFQLIDINTVHIEVENSYFVESLLLKNSERLSQSAFQNSVRRVRVHNQSSVYSE
ncbi:MAG: hypothetical protein FWD05_04490 [Oscillospiraceae bacterium]|nr:hypothetical protein [Oscillospiraceae bacterium]